MPFHHWSVQFPPQIFTAVEKVPECLPMEALHALGNHPVTRMGESSRFASARCARSDWSVVRIYLCILRVIGPS
eukprot:3502109-Pyramimonas_sp.AAC.1